MPRFKGRYRKTVAGPFIGDFISGRRVVGITYDGVRILEPVEGPSSFTQEECRAAVRQVIEARKATAT